MILVFGSKGQIASHLREQAAGRLDWIFVGSEEASFEDLKTVLDVLNKIQPEVVVNCAAYTQVDLAESEQDLCYQINARAVQKIAMWCFSHKSLLIHFSTDYVYPGDKQIPWRETDTTNPTNWYGQSKRSGEDFIEKSGADGIILRTSWVFSEHGINFVKTMRKLMQERSELKIVNDQVGSPTYAGDLAVAVDGIIDQYDNAKKMNLLNEWKSEKCGIYNISNSGFTTWKHFADEIWSQLRSSEQSHLLKVQQIIGIPSDQFKSAARRPLNSRLDQSKLIVNFDIKMPSWQNALTRCLAKLIF